MLNPLGKPDTRRDGARTRVAAALERWKKAQAYFESVEDEELIDFAIFDMEAARRKYMLLLRRVE